MKAIMEENDNYKITQKISVEDFCDLLKEHPNKITISQSVLNQSKSVKLYLDALQSLYQSTVFPKIEIVGRKVKPRIIQADWMDPYLRELVEESPPVGISLEMELMRLGAVSKDKAVPIYEFTHSQQKEIPGLVEAEHLILEKGLRIYLSELGADIARGALKIYRKD
ncbi:MAG: hypothetical protein U9O96_00805 [Candidatus Thermoplasmatota archaeon]|nr:hypothetical protein [Candidatus Thermoplasmatota archaeon]